MSLEHLDLQRREHEAWVKWAKLMDDIGFNLNDVDVLAFEPARVALCEWAILYAEGHHAGVFTTLR